MTGAAFVICAVLLILVLLALDAWVTLRAAR